MNPLKEYQCRIVAENRRKQYEVKENTKWSIFVKRAACIIKKGRSYDNILSSVAKLDTTHPNLQATPPNPPLPALYSETLNDAFIHMHRWELPVLHYHKIDKEF